MHEPASGLSTLPPLPITTSAGPGSPDSRWSTPVPSGPSLRVVYAEFGIRLHRLWLGVGCEGVEEGVNR